MRDRVLSILVRDSGPTIARYDPAAVPGNVIWEIWVCRLKPEDGLVQRAGS